jgi:hypothetical protein
MVRDRSFRSLGLLVKEIVVYLVSVFTAINLINFCLCKIVLGQFKQPDYTETIFLDRWLLQ